MVDVETIEWSESWVSSDVSHSSSRGRPTRLSITLKTRAKSSTTPDVQQQEFLLRVRRGLVEVASSKVQLERQSEKLRTGIPRLEDQAERALSLGRDDLARIVLQRKHTTLAGLESLESHVSEIGEEEARLTEAQQRLLWLDTMSSAGRPSGLGIRRPRVVSE